ncbi:MAG: hypothetical protein K0S07_1265, partial [Chlamydiales bacterium]|nr:hypothetical protein [Chlamydiales bacterium]
MDHLPESIRERPSLPPIGPVEEPKGNSLKKSGPSSLFPKADLAWPNRPVSLIVRVRQLIPSVKEKLSLKFPFLKKNKGNEFLKQCVKKEVALYLQEKSPQKPQNVIASIIMSSGEKSPLIAIYELENRLLAVTAGQEISPSLLREEIYQECESLLLKQKWCNKALIDTFRSERMRREIVFAVREVDYLKDTSKEQLFSLVIPSSLREETCDFKETQSPGFFSVDCRKLPAAFLEKMKQDKEDCKDQLKKEPDLDCRVGLIDKIRHLDRAIFKMENRDHLEEAILRQIEAQIEDLDIDKLSASDLETCCDQLKNQPEILQQIWKRAFDSVSNQCCFKGFDALPKQKKRAFSAAHKRYNHLLSIYFKKNGELPSLTLKYDEFLPVYRERFRLTEEEIKGLSLLSLARSQKGEVSEVNKERLNDFLLSLLGNDTLLPKLVSALKEGIPTEGLYGIDIGTLKIVRKLAFRARSYKGFAHVHGKLEKIVASLKDNPSCHIPSNHRLRKIDFELIHDFNILNESLVELGIENLVPENSAFSSFIQDLHLFSERSQALEDRFQQEVNQTGVYRSGDITAVMFDETLHPSGLGNTILRWFTKDRFHISYLHRD